MNNQKDYVAAQEGWILGAYRKVGEPVGALSETQAKYLLMSGQIAPSGQKPSVDRKKAEKSAAQPSAM